MSTLTNKELFERFKHNTAGLPRTCFAPSVIPGYVKRLNKGWRGYKLPKTDYTATEHKPSLGVTDAQAAAMLAGATYGFHSCMAHINQYLTEDPFAELQRELDHRIVLKGLRLKLAVVRDADEWRMAKLRPGGAISRMFPMMSEAAKAFKHVGCIVKRSKWA